MKEVLKLLRDMYFRNTYSNKNCQSDCEYICNDDKFCKATQQDNCLYCRFFSPTHKAQIDSFKKYAEKLGKIENLVEGEL